MNRSATGQQVLWRTLVRAAGSWSQPSFPFPAISSRSASTSFSDEDFDQARRWYAESQGSLLPRKIGEVSFSRSSGPGGQNVNKVNSKAQLRVPLTELLPLLPSVLHDGIRSSRYFADNTNSLLIQADDSRKQAANKDSCFRKLNELITGLYKATVPGETSHDQKDKVQKLQKAENESRLRSKKVQSNKKASRSRKSFD